MDSLIAYTSIDEEESDECVFCKQSEEDPLRMGFKKTIDDVTAHQFCLVCFFLKMILAVLIKL